MSEIEIVGVGFCSLDYLSIIPFVPLDGKVEIISDLTQGGGPAATAIVAAARLGALTAFIGAVGNDNKGLAILDGLKAENVNTNYMQIKSGETSPGAFCWVEKDTGKRSIAWTRGTSMPLDASHIDEKLIASAKLLHLDGHNTEAAIRAALIARENGVLVSLDAGTIVPRIDELVLLSDICIASEYFALKFTGKSDVKSATRCLYDDYGCKVAAVTSGEKGVFAIANQTEVKQEAFKVAVVDTTGAGDVFHGAFAYAWIQGWNIKKSLEFASATAALKCTKFGGRTGIPTIQEVLSFLQTYK